MSTLTKIVISIVTVVVILFGGVVTVASAVNCGITTLSPVAIGSDIADKVTKGAQDAFFDLFAPADAKQRKANAAVIVKVGEDRGFSKRSLAIAVATSIQETNLENRPYNKGGYNDYDSIGLFQQRPSQGWGTPAQLLDPVYASNKFYDVLQTIPDRDSRPMMEVALQIQRASPSAYRNRWAWDDIATAIVDELYAGKTTEVGTSKCTAETSNEAGWRVPLDPGYRISSPFGFRINPYTGRAKNHDGVDMAIASGTPIYAVHDGTVTFSGVSGSLGGPNGGGSGYGNLIRIDHGDGIGSGYGHLSKRIVSNGEKVRAGQVIGYVGSTGGSTGAHLHFEIKENGQFINPDPFMEKNGADISP